MRARPTLRRFSSVAAVMALAVALGGCDDPPITTTTNVNYGCQIATPLLPTTTGTLDSDYTVTAPQAVKPDSVFQVQVVPEPYFVDGSPTSGGTVTETSQMKWRVAIPAGTTLDSHSIAGWAGVGPGAPTSTATAGYVEISVPGPIPAGTTATLPTLTLKLEATGAVGTTIQHKIHGSSYAAHGLTLKTRITGTLLGTLTPTLSCFPNPSPVLRSTLISNDVKAPAITITTPAADGSYARNAALTADFSCSDGDGVGVATCVGTVADGASIGTSAAGTKTFTVTATDLEGKVSTKTVTYTVRP